MPESPDRSTSDTSDPQQVGRLQLAQAGGAAQTLGVLAPAAGETLRQPVTPGEAVLIGFDPYQAGVVIQGDDLVFLFDNGGRIVLESFAAATAEDGATALLLPSGVTVTGAAALAQIDEDGLAPPLETAAGNGGQGPAPSSGGGLAEALVFDQTLGDVVELIETLVLAGALPSATLGFVSTRTTLALQMANDDNVLLVPGAGPAPAEATLPDSTILGAPGGGLSGQEEFGAVSGPEQVSDEILGEIGGVFGTEGDDVDPPLEGTDSPEFLNGLAGNDRLLGNGGDDILSGGPGADELDGGEGDDIFLYSAGDGGGSLALADIITDFEDGLDRIGLLDELDFGSGDGEAQFVAANDLGLAGEADDTALVITDGDGLVTEILAVIDSVVVGALDETDVVLI